MGISIGLVGMGSFGSAFAPLLKSHPLVDRVALCDREPEVNIWEAARYMAMGIMAHKSALRDGDTLDVPDWGDAPA